MLGRHPDMVVLAAAFPMFVVAQLPMLAYVGAALIWIVQATAQVIVDRKLVESSDARTVLALTMGTAIARAFFSAFAVLALGLSTNDETGLAAVLMLFTLFTVYLVGKLIRHGDTRRPTAGGSR
jgi:hypothetical protein